MDLVLASGNAGKLREFASLLATLPLTLRLQSEFDVPPVAETGTTFIENAIIKARHAAAVTGLAAMADDSGLCVDALGGEPGVRSARYAGDGASDGDNVTRLLGAAADLAPAARACRFVCVIVCLRHAGDPLPLIATGEWHGNLLQAPRGTHGFGYDPVFGVDAQGHSAAELEAEEKNRRSHRGLAVAALLQQFGTRWNLN